MNCPFCGYDEFSVVVAMDLVILLCLDCFRYSLTYEFETKIQEPTEAELRMIFSERVFMDVQKDLRMKKYFVETILIDKHE